MEQQEARGVFLMDGADGQTPPPSPAAAAAGVLRILTCGIGRRWQVHSSPPPGRLLYSLDCVPTDLLTRGREQDLRPARARLGPDLIMLFLLDGLGGRTRAGNHNRCRLSLPLESSRRAFVIASLARPRTVHA